LRPRWLWYLFCLVTLRPALAEPSPIVVLARDAVRAEVLGQQAPAPHAATPPQPVFVTIERRGRILGCRGTLESRSRSLEQEVLLAARAAAGHDPRYRPLTSGDLDGFLVTVTRVERLEPISQDDVPSLTPDQGLVLRAGEAVGVVLPWEGKDPRVRLEWAYRKAGVRQGTGVRLFRMIAERERG